MSLRTLNYTNRKRIRREHARISIREENAHISFDAILKLKDYRLSSDAHVFVEAYRQAQYMRFDYGRVGALRAPQDRSLGDFSSPDGILFRVKVVVSDPHGLLLAEADGIRPTNATEEMERRISLLPIQVADDLGDEIWRIEFDGCQPILKVNARLGDKDALAKHPVFHGLVYPAVVRTILTRILHIQGHRDTEDLDDWRSCWLCFAVGLPGVGSPPDKSSETHLDDWIDQAVEAFCRRHDVCALYGRFWTEVEGQ